MTCLPGMKVANITSYPNPKRIKNAGEEIAAGHDSTNDFRKCSHMEAKYRLLIRMLKGWDSQVLPIHTKD